MHALRNRWRLARFALWLPGVALAMVLSVPALWATPADSAAKLKEQLKSPDEKVRIAAIDALAQLGPAAKEAVAELTAQLDDKSPRVRARAARALRALGPAAQSSAARLAELTTDPDARVRRMAVAALHTIGPAEVAVPALAKELTDADPAVRIAALDGLADFGEASAGALAAALDNPETRYWAALAIGDIGPPCRSTVDALTRSLKDDRPDVRYEVLIALARVGPDAAKSVTEIQTSLSDPDPSVRTAAAFALGHIGTPAAPAADALRKAVDDSEGLLPTVAAWAIARIEPTNEAANKQAVKMLTKALENKDPQVRAAALRGLVGLVTEPANLVPVLTEIVGKKEQDAALTAEALGAAAHLGEVAMPVLVEALKQPEGRGRAAVILARLGSKADAAVPALGAALVDKDPEVRREVLFALAALGEKAAPAQAAIEKSLGDSDEHVRAIAAYALGRIGAKAHGAVPQLRRQLESPDPVVRVSCAWAIVHIDGNGKDAGAVARETLPILIQGLKQENIAVRRGSAEALGVLGKAARSAIPALQAASRDPDDSVAKAALAALERVGGIIITPQSRPVPQKRR